jgi:Methyltransferase domain
MSDYRSPPIQTEREHNAFIDILRRENVRSYLEIGSMWGQSLWKVALALPMKSRVVSVDSMVDRPGAQPMLQACVNELKRLGFDAVWVKGDSTNPAVVDIVRKLAPFDALFIDGNHSFPYVKADWENYGPMARIVGFHDINYKNTWRNGRGEKLDDSKFGVPQLWESLKGGYRHEEFRWHPQNNYHGIGVLWH